MDAFFCIDKPVGITSFGVLFQMRKILGVKKIGHTGTLDPLASGCLLVATGAYTKLIPYFEKDQKGYDVIVGLDGESPSYDTETPIEYISPELQEKLKQDISFSSLQEICSEHFL